MLRARTPVTLLAACATAGLVAATVTATATAAPAAKPKTASRTVTTAATAATAATGVQFQTWLYPGSPGNSTCTAAAEYADNRVLTGALKPEYWSVQSNGSVRLET